MAEQPHKDKISREGDTAKADVKGEGNYSASRRFDEKQQKFVEAHKGEIAQKGKDAEKALDGSEGEDLRRAEDEAKRHAKH